MIDPIIIMEWGSMPEALHLHCCMYECASTYEQSA
jgi:hypothetical protein